MEYRESQLKVPKKTLSGLTRTSQTISSRTPSWVWDVGHTKVDTVSENGSSRVIERTEKIKPLSN